MQKMLDDSETRVTMAESELVSVQEELQQLRFQNETLGKQLEVLVCMYV